ncbi:hypothetical protein DICSQDRAFT_81120 [Dichomitus squalens LYAD-421 SS1]|uniref:uncharacterized protein n=1 Tax=Dichomitus squalens (strain LYAD-421) TaxID=732165 RepID=UPI0004415DA2|nr:uncharacterized protein DICSQDRAFT_81120 [Dichomitus squalens LYAD-421 SS1]EJF64114.1 hypothetical protein DICSQDRAFT_81120 [Dichomitus squalens LYAD-421 SS1]
MFNAPRPVQAYGSSSQFGASFVTENPLISSVYDDGLDPWSTSPSPAPPALPSFGSTSSGFSSVIGDATLPLIYNRAFSAVDPSNTGETSVNALSRVLGTSSLPASTVDKIVSLVSSRPRVSRLEFFVALALAALAQSGKDVSVERVAALAQENALPEPALDLNSLPPTNSTFQDIMQMPPPIPARGYSTEDPWASRFTSPSAPPKPPPAFSNHTNGAPSSISGTGLPREWWKKQETVFVNVLGQQGFILNRYLVYEVSSDRGAPVPRRYSEFVFLWDVLVKRYPFRLLPALPPKRIGPDEGFLEQRRRGLARFINFVVNHPVIKDDAVLQSFLTEPSLEEWRKHTAISYEEESASKRVDRLEEMAIPSDLEDKLTVVRGKIGFLIEHWQRICLLTERIVRRREAAAVRLTPVMRPSFLPTHLPFPLPSFGGLSSSPSSASSALASSSSGHGYGSGSGSDRDADSSSSIFSGLTSGARGTTLLDGQADLARLTNTMKSLVESNERCWRGEDCELCAGVRQGLVHVSTHTQRHADALEHRSRTMLYSTLEALKAQRDLYVAMRDLFIRHDRLSLDQVDRLRKRVDTNSHKLEGIRQAQKEGWQQEADKIAGLIEKDQAAIAAALARRVFIRACMWHELRVVLHNRENTLLTQAVRSFAREEHDFSEGAVSTWASLLAAVETMPLE